MIVAPSVPESSTVAEAPPAAPAAAAITDAAVPSDSTAEAATDVTAPIDIEDPVAETPARSDSAGFAQNVPVVAPLQPETAPVVEEPAADVAAAPAAQTTRPPPPPDPGTGQSTLIEGGTNGRLEVALTFDAGADTGYGAQVLDLLRAEGIPATFGMTGIYAQANPQLVQRMVAEGHQLINHTWDHPSLTGVNSGLPALTPEQIAQQLGDTEAVVRDLTGYEMLPYFRPPYGDYDAPSLGYLYDQGYTLSIMWTCDSRGWDGWSGKEIVDYCTTNIRPHEILLMHLGADAAGDLEALPGLIQFFRDSGYSFVTVEQMLQP